MRTVATALCAGALLSAACGADTDRPSAAEWRPEWESTRALVPDAAALEARGAALCGDFLGEVRVRRDELRPTPNGVVDDAFSAWIDEAEALGLDCVDDPGALDERLRDIEQLADQVDLSLSGE